MRYQLVGYHVHGFSILGLQHHRYGGFLLLLKAWQTPKADDVLGSLEVTPAAKGGNLWINP